MATLKNTKLSDVVPERVDGVAPGSDGNVALGAVRYGTSQTLSDAQKEQALANIDAADANHTHSSIVSQDGNTSVAANNDGTATITAQTAAPVIHFSNFTGGGLSGFTGEVRLKGPFLGGVGWVEESAPDPSAIGDFFSGHSICDPGAGFYMLFYNGYDYARVSGLDTSSPEVLVYSGSGDVSVDYSTSSRVATMADIGDINAVLDAINGESV